ncbi:MAG: hypothetical protein FD172_3910 [Methylocystaceae bacterium]|nr:MAG: hypothetical protein FD172_3910 [Methylocystaceae bacterium]
MPEQGWKPSAFNVELDAAGRRFVYNSISLQMLELDEATLACFRDSMDEIRLGGRCADERMLQCFLALGFVVPASEAEYEREQTQFSSSKADRDTLKITLAPTMACNLRCSYCFQQDFAPSRNMKAEVQNGVIEFVRRKAAGSRRLVVQWFGGEPLLRYEQIVSMTEAFQKICAERDMIYEAEMLTNGTLLTPEIIDSFRRLSLRAIQIPMDGDIATYARRKGATLKRAEDFHQFLLGHMPQLVAAVGSVKIRINVDRDNADAGKDVVRMFNTHGCCDPRIDFRLGFLNTRDGIIECIPHDCLSDAEFAAAEADFRQFLAREGFRVYDEPFRRKFPCAAPLERNFTIDPSGRIGKCVPAIGSDESVFSRIYPENIERTIAETSQADAPYADYDPFESEMCRKCALLPVCLGSCPKLHVDGVAASCRVKEGFAEKVLFHHDRSRGAIDAPSA